MDFPSPEYSRRTSFLGIHAQADKRCRQRTCSAWPFWDTCQPSGLANSPIRFRKASLALLLPACTTQSINSEQALHVSTSSIRNILVYGPAPISSTLPSERGRDLKPSNASTCCSFFFWNSCLLPETQLSTLHRLPLRLTEMRYATILWIRRFSRAATFLLREC